MDTKMNCGSCKALYSFAVLTAILASVLSGCVYVRLLAVKQQLSKFDTYFRVNVSDVFNLEFNKPVLFREDFDNLAKLSPSRTEPLSGGKRTVYELQKLNSDGRLAEPQVPMEFILEFDEKDMLTSWTFSSVFLAMFPAEFLEISLRALGASKIFRARRQVRADLSKIDIGSARLPRRQTIESVLGLPLQVVKRENAERLLYRFKLKAEKVEAGYEERQFTLLKLDFDSRTHELLKMSGRFVGMKIAVDYRKFRSESKPR